MRKHLDSMEVGCMLKGLSATIATLNSALLTGDVKPTDETVSDILFNVEVQLDQLSDDIDRENGKELCRLQAIAKYTGIPLNRLMKIGSEAIKRKEFCEEWK